MAAASIVSGITLTAIETFPLADSSTIWRTGSLTSITRLAIHMTTELLLEKTTEQLNEDEVKALVTVGRRAVR